MGEAEVCSITRTRFYIDISEQLSGSCPRQGRSFFFLQDLEVSGKRVIFAVDMKKEIGKWFMDIAKYIATAVLLTQIFGGLADSPFIIVYALLSVIAIFSIGVSILHGDDEDQNRKERNRNKKGK